MGRGDGLGMRTGSARSAPAARYFSAVLALLSALASLAPGAAQAFGACQAFVEDRRQPQATLARATLAQTTLARTTLAQTGPKQTPPEAIPTETLAITFLKHATFLIQTPQGVAAATDYAGDTPADGLTAVTMNNAHETHYTLLPDKRIAHVLRGWPQPGQQRAEHRVAIKDLKIRNVPTDIVISSAARRKNGNSIFIFELGDLCVAHLGHLHHPPTDAQYAEIGFLDVVMAPVDGGLTMPHDQMADVLRRLRARLVLPMHYFTPKTLQRFLVALDGEFDVKLAEDRTLLVSKATLPPRPTLLVLPPQYEDDLD